MIGGGVGGFEIVGKDEARHVARCSGEMRRHNHIWRERKPKRRESAIRPRFVQDSFHWLIAPPAVVAL
jgi:hypothetical protein